MQNEKERLDAFAARVSQMVNELPNDGPERQFNVTVGGDNHGNITFGNHITINTASSPQREERPLTDAELMLIEQRAKRQQYAATFRAQFNPPALIKLGILILALVSLYKGWLSDLTPEELLFAFAMGAFFYLWVGRWSRKIRRLEQPLIQEAQSMLEAIYHERHRRRVM